METILHLTDIHFGWEGENPSELANRKICLDGLLGELRGIDALWKPTIICLSGDIAWRGAESDYASAKKWLDELLKVCDLTYEQMVVCPGNHDVIRSKAEKLARPESTKEADKVLTPPIAEHFEGPFVEFVAFCRKAGIPAFKFGALESHLVGSRIIKNIRFTTLNSAWFSKDDDDKEKLWFGQPHLKYMEAHNQLPFIQTDAPLTIALIHHPAEWLHPDEKHVAGLRPNSTDYLAHRGHLLLTGHTHGEVRAPDRIADRALHFTGGSAYAGASHFNSFRLIRITKTNVFDRAFEFNPTSSQNRWHPRPADNRPLIHQKTIEERPIALDGISITTIFRHSFRKHATYQLELKSRLLRQVGALPTTISRPVSARVSIQRDQYDSEGRLIRPKTSEQVMSFHESIRGSRRTLLLGDLGTGKSTLAAQLVTETLDRSHTAVAILVPLKALQFSGQFSQRDLLSKIDQYITDDVLLKPPKFEFASMLAQGIEVLLVLDGLDELPRDIAARLLNRAAALVDSWSTIQVVVTARPIELLGVSYSDWRIVYTTVLDDAAKSEFIRQELIADGIPPNQLSEKTASFLAALKEMVHLDTIANSPLVIRLVYPRLAELSSRTSITLGELVYDLLLERLDGWQKRDDKPSSYSLIEQVLPTPEDKAEFLAILAEKKTAGKRIGLDEAKSLLEARAAKISSVNAHQLAAEAISFYEWLGLISKGDPIEVPLQPLAEVCAAVGLHNRWCERADGTAPERRLWRVVSFVAAIARRRGTLERVRESLTTFIDELVTPPNNIPAACYIVVEAADDALAVHTVLQMDKAGYRPLTTFQDERIASARNIAKTLVLAGEKGFEWFYKDYLDPKYPIPLAGSGIVRELIAEWAALVRFTLTEAQKLQLRKLVVPYQTTEEGQLHGILNILSVLVPEAFSCEDRFWYESFALDSRLFRGWIRAEFLAAKADEKITKYAEAVILHRSGESIHAARLWLEWNRDIEPPYGIFLLALRCASRMDITQDESFILQQCRTWFGESKWMSFARWAVASGESSVAAGAAKVLYDNGERRLGVLGDVLLKATHDGGCIPVAEIMLSALVSGEGEHGINWLATRIVEVQEMFGTPSCWWTILLKGIEEIANGPAMVAACVRTLGPFVIPRYPEVRENFARVLNGRKGSSFREALRRRLVSLDPLARRGAATILLASDPRNESDALFVAVRSRVQTDSSEWHEWENFCLTLDFGPSVLDSLKARLDQLEPKSRVFAIVLLEKAGVRLDPKYREELMVTISNLGNWYLRIDSAVQALIASECSFAFLLDQMNQPKSNVAHHAAEQLLEFHLERMTPGDAAICHALKHSAGSRTWELAEIMRRVAQEPEFAGLLIEAGKEICKRGGRPALLGLVAQALSNEGQWKEIIWALFCDDTIMGSSSESEQAGMALLEFGFHFKKHQLPIGRAAKECLADPRVKANRWHEAYHWLGLLADEFGGLDKETIRDVVLHGKPTRYAVTTALISRLGEVPEAFSCQRVVRPRPTSHTSYKPQVRNEDQWVQQLKDYGRDSNELHPHLLGTLQQCIFLPQLDEAALTSISSAGRPGILISATLRFIYGEPARMAETIPLLDLWFRLAWDLEYRRNWGWLAMIWRVLRETAFRDNPAAVEAYLAALDGALLAKQGWNVAIACDILNLRHSLTESQIPIVFGEYASHHTYLHSGLFGPLCYWLSQDIGEAARQAVISAAESAILVLNETPWISKDEEHPNTLACLLFPVVQWAHSGKNSEATEAVFLRGIRGVFEDLQKSQNSHNSPIANVLAVLDPLLAKAPPEILGQIITRGVGSLEPSISAFCRLIHGISKNCK